MREFFDYRSPYRTDVFIDLNMYEKIIPIIITILVGYLIYRYRNVLKHDEGLEKRVRYVSGVIFAIVYSSHYLLRFNLYGFDTIILPFHLCSIAMFFALLLIFTENRTIYTFVLMTGVAGGVISMATPILGYNSAYYRYYQFYIAHGLLVLTPFYFMIVKGFVPKKKEVLYSFIILEAIGWFMTIFNYYMNTDFMFLFLDQSKITKFPAIAYFGGIPYYLIPMHLVTAIYFFVGYKFADYIEGKKDLEVNYENS